MPTGFLSDAERARLDSLPAQVVPAAADARRRRIEGPSQRPSGVAALLQHVRGRRGFGVHDSVDGRLSPRTAVMTNGGNCRHVSGRRLNRSQVGGVCAG